jgi:ABC-type polysaccharide/polyol phosphate transport system ATPase subunit
VLSGVNLDIRAGQVIGIGGTNGSGKPTLLRILAGGLFP